LFENLLSKLKIDLVTILFNLKIVHENSQKNEENIPVNQKFEKLGNKKIGRNEPCPCNSGKKYKHCCGAL